MASLVDRAPAPVRVKPKASRDDILMRLALLLLGAYLAITVILPLIAMLKKAVEDKDGNFVGLRNFSRLFADPALLNSVNNTLTIASLTTAITIAIAFVYAYALTRSCMRFKGAFRAIALVPLLAPSLLPGLSLVYLFGNKGILTPLLFGQSIYGPIGIIIGEVFFCLPHAVMIIVTALSMADQRLYEAAQALRASRSRIFLTVTLPGCRYGLISACFVVFTLAFTDFGVPKVIGGSYDVLATDVYKQVIGQFNFQMGAVVGLMLLTPAALSFVVDRIVTAKQVALLSARAVPYQPTVDRGFDRLCFAFCVAIAFLVLGIIGMAAFGSIITYWPYKMAPTLAHYDFAVADSVGWGAFWNSVKMASATGLIGTAIVFFGAYLTEKSKGIGRIRAAIQFMAMIPLAVPGLVLGLSYIFFFNAANNPLNFLYLTLALLVINTIAHFYTVCHLTATTALKQMDAEFESVSASLKVPFYRTFWRVTVPVCLPAILDIAIYFFVNAMTTVSAVVFIYGSETKLASISVLNMDDAGKTASAAAMGMVIFATCAGVRGLQLLLARGIDRRTQAWRKR